MKLSLSLAFLDPCDAAVHWFLPRAEVDVFAGLINKCPCGARSPAVINNLAPGWTVLARMAPSIAFPASDSVQVRQVFPETFQINLHFRSLIYLTHSFAKPPLDRTRRPGPVPDEALGLPRLV